MVFNSNFLADDLFCPGLGKVKPSFSDKKSSNLTRFRWGQQIVSKLLVSVQIVKCMRQNCIFLDACMLQKRRC